MGARGLTEGGGGKAADAPPGPAHDLSAPRAAPPRRRPVIRWLALCFGLVVVLPLLVVLGRRLGTDPRLVRSPLLGEPVPTFSLPRIDAGGTLSSAELSGRLYILNFWASWCVPCREETPVLDDFYRRWQPRGVELVGILYADEPEAAKKFRRQLGGTWPLVDDPRGRVAIDYGTAGVPETVVVDGRGIIMAKLVGAVAPGTLDKVIERIGANGEPVFGENDRYRSTPP